MSDRPQRKELSNLPNIRESMARFEEWSDRPIMILERDTRFSKPDSTGKRNPYTVWLIDIGNELVYSYPPGGNTDAQLKYQFANNGNQPVKCVMTAVPNQAGYNTYKWYEWEEQDMIDFMNLKELGKNESEQEDDNVPF